jgi:hypothetical protein
MNEELLAASVLFVLSGALLVSHNGFYQLFCNCPLLSKPKSAVHQHAAKLFSNTGSTSKGIMTSTMPSCVGIHRKKYFQFDNKSEDPKKILKPPATFIKA